MKLGHVCYALKSLRSNPKYGACLKRPRNLENVRTNTHTPFKGPITPRSRRVPRVKLANMVQKSLDLVGGHCSNLAFLLLLHSF